MKKSMARTERRNESGMILMIVVCLTMVMGVLAAALFSASTSHARSATQYELREQAFYNAESGVEYVVARLSAEGLGGFTSNLWSGGPVSFAGVDFKFTAQLTELSDDENLVTVWSTGVHQNASRSLESCFIFTPATRPPTNMNGAIAVYGENTTITLGGNSEINGNDQSVNPGMPVAGVSFASTSSVAVMSGNAKILGDPSEDYNPAITVPKQWWIDFAESLRPIAHVISEVEIKDAEFGTPTAPAVVLIDVETKITGNVSGYGIMIVEGEIHMELGGTFDYEGIIILLGDNSELNFQGTPHVYGAIVAVGDNVLIGPQGTPKIHYSSQRLVNLRNDLPMTAGAIDLVYWRQDK